jgi:tetratricopeptide (TPR) repeat protein
MRKQLLRLGVAAALAMPVSGGAALAAGESSPPECARGKVWDNATQKCVEKTSLNGHDRTYEDGRELARAGRYGEAIVLLSSIADSGDPRVLNYLGYSHRMQGRIEVGLGYYEEALRVNPDFTLAREYMGEAYLQKGDIAAALGQLFEIEKRCGKACEEYVELQKRVDD